jgi:hypothetical protein
LVWKKCTKPRYRSLICGHEKVFQSIPKCEKFDSGYWSYLFGVRDQRVSEIGDSAHHGRVKCGASGRLSNMSGVCVHHASAQGDIAHMVHVKFDSGCSRNMSGVRDRLLDSAAAPANVSVRGFNNSVSAVDSVGLNEDGKVEYYVPNMPSDMVLLSAHDYARDGAAVLMADSGVVLRMSDEERSQLEAFISRFEVTKNLVVRNRTYEVVPCEDAMSSTATRYFNSKVHVSSVDERIMVMLLTGLSFNDLLAMVENDSVQGLPRDLSVASLHRFERKFGRTPDVLQLAVPIS